MTLTKLTGNIKSLTEIAKINEIIDALNAGISITIDAELSENSPNPVANGAIYTALAGKQDTLTAGTGISISDDGIISSTQNSAEWGNISGTLSEQSDLMTVLNEKQNLLIAGAGISISDTNEISVIGGTAEWGNITGTLTEQADLVSALNEKQGVLTAGSNISISNEGVISAKDTTYTAGTGISISTEGVISSTQTSAEWGNITGTLSEQTDLQDALNLKQNVLTAGTGISISNEGVISGDYVAGTGIAISDGVISSTANLSYTASCPALTPVNGLCNWTITHNLGTRNVVVSLFSGDVEVERNVHIDSDNAITITFEAVNNVTAGSRKAIILANGSALTSEYIGGWVFSTRNIYDNQTITEGTHNVDLSNYLPNDGNQYEVMVYVTSSDNANIMLTSDIGHTFGGTYHTYDRNQVIVPVGTGRVIYVNAYGADAPGSFIHLVAYKRTSFTPVINADTSNLANKNLNNTTDIANIKMAHMAMPGSKYIQFIVGASGTEYTMPADGYLSFTGVTSSTNNGVSFECSAGSKYYEQEHANSTPLYIGMTRPVRKGEKFVINYWGISDDYRKEIYFTYCVGSESEAN